MDKKDRRVQKGVPFQGFKGFKLKSSQILRKNSLSRKNCSEKEAHKKARLTGLSPLTQKFGKDNAASIGASAIFDEMNVNTTPTICIKKSVQSEVFLAHEDKSTKSRPIGMPTHSESDRVSHSNSFKAASINGLLVASCKVILQNKREIHEQVQQRDNHGPAPDLKLSEESEMSSEKFTAFAYETKNSEDTTCDDQLILSTEQKSCSQKEKNSVYESQLQDCISDIHVDSVDTSALDNHATSVCPNSLVPVTLNGTSELCTVDSDSYGSKISDVKMTFLLEQTSNETAQLVYPAKKRYHEWFKNKSTKDNSVNGECVFTDASIASGTLLDEPRDQDLHQEHLIALTCRKSDVDSDDNSSEEVKKCLSKTSSVSSLSAMDTSCATETISDLKFDENCLKSSADPDVPIDSDSAQSSHAEILTTISNECELSTSSKVFADSEKIEDDQLLNDLPTNSPHSANVQNVCCQSQSKQQLADSFQDTLCEKITVTVDKKSFDQNKNTTQFSLNQDVSPIQSVADQEFGSVTNLISNMVTNQPASPEIDYNLSDSSSLTGSLSPIDIRIPIDNCEETCSSIQEKESISYCADQKKSTTVSDNTFCESTEFLEDKQSPPKFALIEENIYLFQKKKSRARKEIRRMLCDCMSNLEDPPCGENCLNRLLMIECSPRCPYRELCTNKRFQRRQYLSSEVFRTSWKGWGLRAATDFPPGQLVMEYCGEVLDADEFYRRSQFYAENNQQHFYFMALSQDEIIDATYKGNVSRFINHSCEPNCETQKWTVNGRLCVGIFTINGVKAGEEITFDYQFKNYGKERQKCYCGAPTCRGYLSKAESHHTAKYERSSDGVEEENMVVMKEFKESSVENELNRLVHGLETTKEVLLLCRLMVRSESVSDRVLCLKVLRRTSNQASLKAFLHFHGLSLMWSWMVDCEEMMQIKLEVLNTLLILPISNKNVLEDSKVLSMVERWSEKESSPSSTNSQSNTILSDEDDSTKVAVDEDKSKHMQEKIISLSLSLLTIWKNLKEVYRIPKRVKATENEENTQSEEEYFKVKSSSPTKDANDTNDKKNFHDSSLKSVFRHNELKRGCSPARKRRRDDDIRSSKNHSVSRYEIRLTREAHRKQFEKDMLRKIDNQQKLDKDSSSVTPPTTPSTPLTATSTPDSFSPAGYSGNLIQITPDPVFAVTSSTILSSESSAYLTPCSQGQPISVIGASTSQILLPRPQSTMLTAPYTVHPNPQLSVIDSFGINILGYDGLNTIVSLTPEQMKELTDLMTFKSLQQATLHQSLFNQLPYSTSVPAAPPLPIQPLPSQPSEPNPAATSTTTFSATTTNPVSTSLTASLPTDTIGGVQTQTCEARIESGSTEKPKLSASTQVKPSRDHKLPPNWKTASDADGCVYYYHVITRQTQWDPPTLDGCAEETVFKENAEKMEMASPTNKDKHPTLSTDAGVAASDSIQSRKAKEAFRSRMSQHIVTCLSAYRKADCKVGKIQTNEDFKKLARKLTHNILMKEIKQVKVWEDLECNANVKHKAKEYVRKYMSRMGPVYRGKDEER